MNRAIVVIAVLALAVAGYLIWTNQVPVQPVTPVEPAPTPETLSQTEQAILNHTALMHEQVASFATAEGFGVDDFSDFSDYADFVVLVSDLDAVQLNRLRQKTISLQSSTSSPCLPVFEKTVELAQVVYENQSFEENNPVDASFLEGDLCSKLDVIETYNQNTEREWEKTKAIDQAVQAGYALSPEAMMVCNIKPSAISYEEIETDFAQKRQNMAQAKQSCSQTGEVTFAQAIEPSPQTALHLQPAASAPATTPSRELPEDVLFSVDHLTATSKGSTDRAFYEKFAGKVADIKPDSFVGNLLFNFVGSTVLVSRGGLGLTDAVVRASLWTGGKGIAAADIAFSPIGLDVAAGAEALKGRLAYSRMGGSLPLVNTSITSLNAEISAQLQTAYGELQGAKNGLTANPNDWKLYTQYRTVGGKIKALQNAEKIAQAAGTVNKGSEIAALTADAKAFEKLLAIGRSDAATAEAVSSINSGKNVAETVKLAGRFSRASRFLRFTVTWIAFDGVLSVVTNSLDNFSLNTTRTVDLSQVLEQSAGMGGTLTNMSALVACTTEKGTKDFGPLFWLGVGTVDLDHISKIDFVDNIGDRPMYLFSLRCIEAGDSILSPPVRATVRLEEPSSGLGRKACSNATLPSSPTVLSFDEDNGTGDGPLLYSKYYPSRTPFDVTVNDSEGTCYRLRIEKSRGIDQADIAPGPSYPNLIVIDEVTVELHPKIFNNARHLKELFEGFADKIDQKVSGTHVVVDKKELEKVYSGWNTQERLLEMQKSEKLNVPVLAIKKASGESDPDNLVVLMPYSIKDIGEKVRFGFFVPEANKRYALAFYKDDLVDPRYVTTVFVDDKKAVKSYAVQDLIKEVGK